MKDASVGKRFCDVCFKTGVQARTTRSSDHQEMVVFRETRVDNLASAGQSSKELADSSTRTIVALLCELRGRKCEYVKLEVARSMSNELSNCSNSYGKGSRIS